VAGGILTLALDQASKAWVRFALPPGKAVPLVAGAALLRTTNAGITLGLGAAYPEVWALAGLLAAAAVIAARSRLALGPGADAIFGVILGGIVGNLLDRWIFGRVTDFLKVPLWPGVMNVADIAIRAGIVALVAIALVRRRRGGERAAGEVARP